MFSRLFGSRDEEEAIRLSQVSELERRLRDVIDRARGVAIEHPAVVDRLIDALAPPAALLAEAESFRNTRGKDISGYSERVDRVIQTLSASLSAWSAESSGSGGVEGGGGGGGGERGGGGAREASKNESGRSSGPVALPASSHGATRPSVGEVGRVRSLEADEAPHQSGGGAGEDRPLLSLRERMRARRAAAERAGGGGGGVGGSSAGTGTEGGRGGGGERSLPSLLERMRARRAAAERAGGAGGNVGGSSAGREVEGGPPQAGGREGGGGGGERSLPSLLERLRARRAAAERAGGGGGKSRGVVVSRVVTEEDSSARILTFRRRMHERMEQARAAGVSADRIERMQQRFDRKLASMERSQRLRRERARGGGGGGGGGVGGGGGGSSSSSSSPSPSSSSSRLPSSLSSSSSSFSEEMIFAARARVEERMERMRERGASEEYLQAMRDNLERRLAFMQGRMEQRGEGRGGERGGERHVSFEGGVGESGEGQDPGALRRRCSEEISDAIARTSSDPSLHTSSSSSSSSSPSSPSSPSTTAPIPPPPVAPIPSAPLPPGTTATTTASSTDTPSTGERAGFWDGSDGKPPPWWSGI